MDKQHIRYIVADITRLAVDAIVNSANRSLLGGGGVDRAIHRAAGRGLLAECIKLGGCPPGESRLTGGHQLPARHVIHTVGPVWLGGGSGEVECLSRAVTSALDIARREGFAITAFSCISTGIHRFPAELAARTTVEAMLAHPYDGRVVIAVTTDENLQAYRTVLGADALLETPRGS